MPDAIPRCVGDWLEHWAAVQPTIFFLAERNAAGEWDRLEATAGGPPPRRGDRLLAARSELSAERPVMDALGQRHRAYPLALAACTSASPVAPISPGNSLTVRKDFGKLANFELLRPGVSSPTWIERFLPAIAVVADLYDGVVVAGSRSQPQPACCPSAQIEGRRPLRRPTRRAVMAALFAAVGPTSSPVLFSGSVGTPKAVIAPAHDVLEPAARLVWPFPAQQPPVVCEWLPWSPPVGGNHDFNMVLRWGGSFYIDDGKPTPALIEDPAQPAREVSLTILFHAIPRLRHAGAHLRQDAAPRERFSAACR